VIWNIDFPSNQWGSRLGRYWAANLSTSSRARPPQARPRLVDNNLIRVTASLRHDVTKKVVKLAPSIVATDANSSPLTMRTACGRKHGSDGEGCHAACDDWLGRMGPYGAAVLGGGHSAWCRSVAEGWSKIWQRTGALGALLIGRRHRWTSLRRRGRVWLMVPRAPSHDDRRSRTST